MRRASWIVAGAGLVAAAACSGKKQQTAMSDDLAKDVALASTSDGLSMAPQRGGQMVVSPEELSPQARVHRAPSARVTHLVHRRTAPRVRMSSPSTTVAAATAPATAPAQTAPPAPAPSSPAPVDNGSVATVPQPDPGDVHYPSSGRGSDEGRRGGGGSSIGGIGIGTVIGAIGAVILRGGVVDGDHCDPRSDRRHGGMGGIPPILPVTGGGSIFRGVTY